MSASQTDREIERLYQLPLDDFTSARNALAKTLGGAAAAEVRSLPKPTVPAWTVNQLYWQARDVYTALVRASEKLRTTHHAVLRGRGGDLRAADEAHREAITAAARRAAELLEQANHPPTGATIEAINRTLQALPSDDAPPGRLSRPLSPPGIEAFAGIAPTLRLVKGSPAHGQKKPAREDAEKSAREAEAARRRELTRAKSQVEQAESALEEAREQDRAAQAQLRKAETAAARAAAAEDRAREALEAAEATARAAKREEERARRDAEQASGALTLAERDLAAARRQVKDLERA
jgi:hypothetical protein